MREFRELREIGHEGVAAGLRRWVALAALSLSLMVAAAACAQAGGATEGDPVTGDGETLRWTVLDEQPDIVTSDPSPRQADVDAEPVIGYGWEEEQAVEAGQPGASELPDGDLVWEEQGSTESVDPAFAVPNERPVAVAGSDGSDLEATVGDVLAGDGVELDGGGSYDPEGEELTFGWTIVSGPAGGARLLGDDSSRPILATDLPGIYEVELVVSDGLDDSEPDIVEVVVSTWFTDVTGAAGVPGGGLVRKDGIDYQAAYGTGLAWGDYDGDALPDLYLTRFGGDILYVNNGDGTFSDVAPETGLPSFSASVSAAWIDYDNDGHLDLYVVAADVVNVLFRSNGDGTFSDATGASGLDARGGTTALWVDLFNGMSDLFVFGSGDVDGMGPTRLFMNEPDSGFHDVTAVSGLANAGPGGVSWADAILLDYDADGYQDLLLSSAAGSVTLLRYHFPGREFQDITPGSGLETLTDVRSAIAGDYDGDGYHDLFLSGEGMGSLWRNDGNGAFYDVTDDAGLIEPGTGGGFFDFDNDGLQDLFLVNSVGENGGSGSGPDYSGGLSNRLYRNHGDGTFTDVTIRSGLGDPGEATAVGFADYDYDGDLDFYVVNGDGRNLLYRNEVGNRNSWLRIMLRGISSNLLGIGARVEVTTLDGLTRVAFPAGGPEFRGQSDAQLLIGLGGSERADIRVVWPSGLLQDFWGAIPNELIRLREVAMEGW